MMASKKLLIVLNRAGWSFVVIYFVSMFVIPFIQNPFDWNDIQDIWDRWQGFNVGVLALVASISAFNISHFHTERQRSLNYIAARAFLPEALSELTNYCKASTLVFIEAWRRANDPSDRCRTSLEMPIPDLPDGYRGIFQECIKTAEPEVGEKLAYILMRLQIHHSRMQDLAGDFNPNSTMSIAAINIITYLYRIAEVYALINQLFEYARGLEDFDNSPLVWEDYQSALRLADIGIGDYQGYAELYEFIVRAIDREGQ